MGNILEKNISDIFFSVRTMNCLLNNEMRTVGDIISKRPIELLKIKNLGKKSFYELTEILLQLGIELKKDKLIRNWKWTVNENNIKKDGEPVCNADIFDMFRDSIKTIISSEIKKIESNIEIRLSEKILHKIDENIKKLTTDVINKLDPDLVKFKEEILNRINSVEELCDINKYVKEHLTFTER